MSDGQGELLKPYVPRLLIEWLGETPEAAFREVDGSLAFVDISGFTRMTERLARRGKVGAEEVSDTLDACFTQLLSVAYDYGAGLVKWGGDAVLLLFTGDGHAPRACRAAAGMQRTLRRMGRLRTSAGLVTLRMSVGVHSGTFHFFLVGSLHRELIIAGPAASRTVTMETIAEAGEVAVSPETAALLDPRYVGAAKSEALLLKGEPEVPAEWAGPAPDVTGLDLASCLPVAIREHLLAGMGEAEHRPITAAFVEFTGTDGLLERAGPAAVAEALDECLGAAQEITHQHEVTFFETDISRDGGKIMLVAGAPRSAGDDEERMLRSVRAIMDRKVAVPLRIGVNNGRVFAGDFGPPYRRTYSVKGDAVNTAARVMGKARPGQVLCTESVLTRSRTIFHAVALEPFALKGKAKPVQAFDLGAPVRERAAEEIATPLVGRERELASLLEALASARRGRGRVVELIGEPGLGKSRLVTELRSRAGALPVLAAACEQYESSTPYLPARRMLRDLLGIPDDAPAQAAQRLRDRVASSHSELLPWLPLLGTLLDVEVPSTPETEQLEEKFRKPRLEEVTCRLLEKLLPIPMLFVFEDVHWMDEASSDLLRRLTYDVDDRPWLILTTRRDVETGFTAPDRPQSIALRLAALPAAEAAALVQASTEKLPLPPHEIAALAERSGGNPLFLRELVAASRRGGGVETLPDSVEALMTAQIDRLAPRDRSVLRYASVLGATFSVDLLEATLDGRDYALDPDVWRRLADFVGRDSSGAARFRHALIRDAAYEGLPYRRRLELHARVGDTIERLAGANPDERAELLSLHFFYAQRFEEAWRYSRIAGERALAQYANVEAADFYRRALAAAKHADGILPHDRAAAFEALGDVSEKLGAFAAAATAYRSARRDLGDDRAGEARLLRKEAEVAEELGSYVQALRLLGKGLRAVEDAEAATALGQRARLATQYAFARVRQGRHRDALPWSERAIRDAEAAGDREALAWAYMVLDVVQVEMGRLESVSFGRLALAIYEELGDLPKQATLLGNLGARAYYEGDWIKALELFERSREIFARTGDAVRRADWTFNVGEICSHQGRLEEAEGLVQEAWRVWKAAGDRVGAALATSELGRIAYRSGRYEEALALLNEARSEFVLVGAGAEMLETDVRLAECLLYQGDWRGALALAEGSLAVAEEVGETAIVRVPRLQRIRGYALAQAGVLDEAQVALEESVCKGRSASVDYEVALALKGLARLLQADELETESSSILERLGVIGVPEAVPADGTEAGPVLEVRDRSRCPAERYLPPIRMSA